VLGTVTVGGRLDLDGVQFASAVRIETDARELTCQRGRFSGGVRLTCAEQSFALMGRTCLCLRC
jgi:hypothetical protein